MSPSSPERAATPTSSANRAGLSGTLRTPSASALAIALVVALVSVICSIGADARWLVAMGRIVIDSGSIPDYVPYAAASSSGWHNVPLLAELVFYGLDAALGDHGLLLAQLAAVTVASTVLAAGMRRAGAGQAAAALSFLLVAAASLSAFAVVRVQLFSLVLFPFLLLLLRSEARAPTRRIWLLVPLFVLWSNLHGAALVGVAVAGSYLILERGRRRPIESAAILVLSALALLATPALGSTASYYVGVLENEAAARGVGLWAPLSLTAPLDIVFLAAAVPLLWLAVRSRPSLWELGALAGLALITIQSARGGVWLAFMLAAPAAAGLRPLRERSIRLGGVLLGLSAAIVVAGVVRGPLPIDVSDELIQRTLREAAGTPVLAEPVAGEQVAAAGGRVWLANPLDAFSPEDQRLYLDWLEGKRSAADPRFADISVVLTRKGSDAELEVRKLAGARRIAADDGYLLIRLKPR